MSISVAIGVVAHNRHGLTGWRWRGPAWRLDLETLVGVEWGSLQDRAIFGKQEVEGEKGVNKSPASLSSS